MSDECGAYAHTMRAPKCRATVVEIVNQIIPMRRLRMGCCSSWCGDGTDGLVCETGLVYISCRNPPTFQKDLICVRLSLGRNYSPFGA